MIVHLLLRRRCCLGGLRHHCRGEVDAGPSARTGGVDHGSVSNRGRRTASQRPPRWRNERKTFGYRSNAREGCEAQHHILNPSEPRPEVCLPVSYCRQRAARSRDKQTYPPRCHESPTFSPSVAASFVFLCVGFVRRAAPASRATAAS